MLRLAGAEQWPSLSPGLTRIQQRCNVSADMLAACRQLVANQQAFLFISDSKDFFVVLQPRAEHVEILLAAGHNLTRYIPFIEHLARQVGAHRLVARSPRPGWRKLAARHGWQIVDLDCQDTIYQKVLRDGQQGSHHRSIPR